METSTNVSKLIAVIGAGVAGLTTTWKLSKFSNIKVTIFEQSQTFSGRAATRIKPGYFYDIGANYFSSDNPKLEEIIKNHFPSERLIEINKPIWVLQGDNTIKKGDSAHNTAKYDYSDGIETLSRLIWDECNGKAKLDYNKGVAKIVKEKGNNQEKWRLFSSTGEDLGLFDIIVLTPPAPQIAEIFKVSDFQDENVQKEFTEKFEACSYKTIISVILVFKRIFNKEYYALINTDRKHNISWLSFENDKQGHVPEGEIMIMAQMAHGWSKEHYNSQDEEIISNVLNQVKEIFVEDKLEEVFKWGDVKKWKYALPEKAVDPSVFDIGFKHNLFFAGDFVKGKGRVLGAFEEGLLVADKINKERPSL